MAREVHERGEFEDEDAPPPCATIPNLLDLVHLNDAEVLQSIAAKYEVRVMPPSPRLKCFSQYGDHSFAVGPIAVALCRPEHEETTGHIEPELARLADKAFHSARATQSEQFIVLNGASKFGAPTSWS